MSPKTFLSLLTNPISQDIFQDRSNKRKKRQVLKQLRRRNSLKKLRLNKRRFKKKLLNKNLSKELPLDSRKLRKLMVSKCLRNQYSLQRKETQWLCATLIKSASWTTRTSRVWACLYDATMESVSPFFDRNILNIQIQKYH